MGIFNFPMRGFIIFSTIGALGAVTNIVLFAFFVDFLYAPAIPIAILCYVVAATQNYFLNNYWTFHQSRAAGARRHLVQLGKFLFGSLFGLVINLAVLQASLKLFSFATFSQALGIVAALGVNYYVAKKFVFKSGSE
jgi:putative flippase GtrA